VRKLKGILTIVIIEHDMDFLFPLADDISVVHWGLRGWRRPGMARLKKSRLQ
jgi:energy-coupling factor transporter ATP-binding protein EcfA2